MQEIKLIDLMPSSISNDDTVKAICEVLDPYVKKMWDEVDYISIYKNIDNYPDEILDSLAWHFHVDFYQDSMPIETKRVMVKNSIKYHRKKGTPWAVEDMLSNLFNEARLTEWFEYGGDPYYFKIHTKDNLSKEKFHDLISALWVVKNTRSWLETIVLERETKLYVGVVPRVHKEITYKPYIPTLQEGTADLYAGVVQVFKKIGIRQKKMVLKIKLDEYNVREVKSLNNLDLRWKGV